MGIAPLLTRYPFVSLPLVALHELCRVEVPHSLQPRVVPGLPGAQQGADLGAIARSLKYCSLILRHNTTAPSRSQHNIFLRWQSAALIENVVVIDR